MPDANLTEPKTRPVMVSRLSRIQLPLVSKVKMLFSVIFTRAIFFYFSSDYDKNIAKPGDNADKKENEEKPGAGANHLSSYNPT